MRHVERATSPAQIRARAATAFRNRVRGLPKLPPLRPAAHDETPLSLAEARIAFALGIAAPAHLPDLVTRTINQEKANAV